jgi:hypothetical protein
LPENGADASARWPGVAFAAGLPVGRAAGFFAEGDARRWPAIDSHEAPSMRERTGWSSWL